MGATAKVINMQQWVNDKPEQQRKKKAERDELIKSHLRIAIKGVLLGIVFYWGYDIGYKVTTILIS